MNIKQPFEFKILKKIKRKKNPIMQEKSKGYLGSRSLIGKEVVVKSKLWSMVRYLITNYKYSAINSMAHHYNTGCLLQ